MKQPFNIAFISNQSTGKPVIQAQLKQYGLNIKSKSVHTLSHTNFDNTVQLIILDSGISNAQQLNLYEMIRQQTQVMVMALSHNHSMKACVKAMESGFIDYIMLPMQLEYIAARIKVICQIAMQLNSQTAQTAYYFNHYILKPEQQLLITPNKHEFELSLGEFRILNALVNNPNRILSRTQLLDHLTNAIDADAPFDRIIDVYIGRIRKKLKAAGPILKTVRGVGYMLQTHVEKRKR